MSLCESLWVHFVWISLIILDVYAHVFQQTWEVFRHYFFTYSVFLYLSLFFWSSHNAYIRLCFLFFSLLSLCFSELVIFIVLASNSLILSFVCSNLPLNSSSHIFSSVIVLFSFRISFWLVLDFLSLSWYYHFTHTFLLVFFSLFFLSAHCPLALRVF